MNDNVDDDVNVSVEVAAPGPEPAAPLPSVSVSSPPRSSRGDEAHLDSSPPPPDVILPAPEEPPDAFAAFMAYLRLSGKRRLTTVAAQTGAGLRSVQRWAREFDWSSRVNRHQAALLQQGRLAEAALARDQAVGWSDRSAAIREREWEIADDLLEAIQRRLASGTLDEAALASLARTVTLTSRIGRLATGLAGRPPEDHDAADPREQEFDQALETAYGQLPAPPPQTAVAGPSITPVAN